MFEWTHMFRNVWTIRHMFWSTWYVLSYDFQSNGQFRLFVTPITIGVGYFYKPGSVEVQWVVWIWDKEIFVAKSWRAYLQVECRTLWLILVRFLWVVAWQHWWREGQHNCLNSLETQPSQWGESAECKCRTTCDRHVRGLGGVFDYIKNLNINPQPSFTLHRAAAWLTASTLVPR